MNPYSRIILFGTLKIIQGERVITRFQTAKTGALLAYIAFRRATPCSREVLAEMLWPQAELESARNSLRVALNSLRRQLEPPEVPPGAILFCNRSHVELRAEACTTDVAEFEAALAAERQAQNDAERMHLLMEAVNLYQGELLPGWYEDWIFVERERLAAACLAALRRLVRLKVNIRAFEEALEYAHRAIRLDPLRESSHRDVIQLYMALGRPAAAITHYREMDQLFREQMGAAPSAATYELIQHLSLTETSTSNDRAGGKAEAREEARGANETVPQTAVAVPQHRLAHPTGNLPTQYTRFFGRDADLEHLTHLLSPLTPTTDLPGRLVTLTGPGGMGKTRLAVEVAMRLQTQYEGQVWFISLAELSDPRLLIDTVVTAMRVLRSPGADALTDLAAAYADVPVLLVLDNLEVLLTGETARATIESVLAIRTTLRQAMLLVTSRQCLGCDGERELLLTPLPLPTGHQSPAELLRCPSISLFLNRAQEVRPDFQISVGNATAIAELCSRLEGIPLAVELAAAWAMILTPAQMLERLTERFNLLVTRRHDRGARHQALRTAIDYSYELLSPELQRLFCALSIFRGGWTLAAVESICPTADTLSDLELLRRYSLIRVEETGGVIRFRMLETLREYAAEKLTPEESRTLKDTHLRWYLDLAKQAAPHLVSIHAVEWQFKLQQETDNLRAAVEWSLENAQLLVQSETTQSKETQAVDAEPLAIQFAACLWRFWYSSGNIAEGVRWMEHALSQDHGERASPSRLAAHEGAGRLALAMGDPVRAMACHERQLALARRTENEQSIGTALANLAIVCRNLHDFAHTRLYGEERMNRARTRGDRWAVACLAGELGAICLEGGEREAACLLLQESLMLRRALGDQWGAADLLLTLGNTLEQSDPPHPAEIENLGEEAGISAAFVNLGWMALEQGDLSEARGLFLDALTIFQRQGDRWGIALCLEQLGLTAWRQQDISSARSDLTEALRMRRELGDEAGAAFCLRWLTRDGRANL